jgi:hypothetical protein
MFDYTGQDKEPRAGAEVKAAPSELRCGDCYLGTTGARRSPREVDHPRPTTNNVLDFHHFFLFCPAHLFHFLNFSVGELLDFLSRAL